MSKEVERIPVCMIHTLIYKIHTEENKRQILSEIRKEIKNPSGFEAMYTEVDNNFDFYLNLLSHIDAKTRKNTALLLGDLGMQEALNSLWEAYEKETQLFVKSSYLSAISELDYDVFLPYLHQKCDEISSMTLTEENKKHYREELRILNNMIISREGINTHIFTGYLHEHDCILLTNREYKEITEKQISDGEILPFSAGVRVKTSKLRQLLEIRTWQELLFLIPGMAICPSDPDACAKKIAESELLAFLKKDHKGTLPFYFRIELKSKMPLDKKAAFTKRLSSSLEQYTNRKLINSPKDYEFEIRMIESKDGMFHTLVKYMTIPDVRFDYREEHVATSIKPSTAALLVALAKEYMIPDAQVLDPFCGVATMLIERQMVVKGNTSYAIDTSAEAIEKAKHNVMSAGQIIHFINKNFFDFTHEYKFDEIFTNMPWAIGKVSHDDITLLYSGFFKKARTVLTPTGTIIIYTHDAQLAESCAKKEGYTVKKSYSIHAKEGTALMIFR